MKYFLLFTFPVILCVSCTHDYICNCSVISTHTANQPDIVDHPTYNFKTKNKSDAQAKCNAVWSSSGVYSYSCAIQ